MTPTRSGGPAGEDTRIHVLDLPLSSTRHALERCLEDLGERPFRARQILHQLHRRRVRSFDAMTDLPADLRGRLAERVRLGLLDLSHRAASRDGTIKYLWSLPDGQEVESVAMPVEGHLSLCISSQVGCALHCRFCATASLGLRRNLSQGEMVDQVLAMLGDLDAGAPAPSVSVVFMGMGEPGYNMDSVLGACQVLNSPDGLGVGARHLTISTAGVVPAILELAAVPHQFRLAVSLHSGDQARRETLMDVAKRYPLSELLDACRTYQHATGRRITFEYAVMPGVNDAPEDAESVAAFASEVPSKINLIPFNPVAGFEASASSERDATRFRAELVRHFAGDVMIRRTRGRDIEAACGMLHRSRAAAPGVTS